MLTETKIKAIKRLRYAKKYFDGGGLYLLVTPTGARCWRYRYRIAGKDKTLALEPPNSLILPVPGSGISLLVAFSPREVTPRP